MEDLTQMAETHGLLLENHFGCQPGRTTTDSLHYVTIFVKDAWRRGKVVSALFLDIKSAFPSVVLKQLTHDMRKQGVPMQYTAWLRCRVEGRQTVLRFDGYKTEPVELARGLDQGCPLSGVAFQFYNADLLDICVPAHGEDTVAFMDNTLILAWGKTLDKSNQKV